MEYVCTYIQERRMVQHMNNTSVCTSAYLHESRHAGHRINDNEGGIRGLHGN